MARQHDEGAALTRRTLLRYVAISAGAAAVAAVADAVTAPSSAASLASTRAAAAKLSGEPVRDYLLPAGRRWPSAHASATATGEPVQATAAPVVAVPHRPTRPASVGTWDSPVRRLDDFTRRFPHTGYSPTSIMLTIDDGPDPEWTPKYLQLLAKYDVQATFCVIGREVNQNPNLVRAAATEGHHIANHTFAHPENLPVLSAARIHAEIENTSDAIVRASGFHPSQFRAPGGVWGPAVYAEASRQNLVPLGWDIDPRDWSLPGVPHIRAAMLAARPHDIILCHDGGGNRAQTYAALESVIPALLGRGWNFVTMPMPMVA